MFIFTKLCMLSSMERWYSMLPIERQQQIVTWLEQEGTLRVLDISQRLKVSDMTVYRDIKPLIE